MPLGNHLLVNRIRHAHQQRARCLSKQVSQLLRLQQPEREVELIAKVAVLINEHVSGMQHQAHAQSFGHVDLTVLLPQASSQPVHHRAEYPRLTDRWIDRDQPPISCGVHCVVSAVDPGVAE